MDYQTFLARKQPSALADGINIAPTMMHGFLHGWQQEIVSWALRTARAAIWANTGTGKTVMQLEWARHVAAHTNLPVLIVAPLAVAAQTVREGAKINVDLSYVKEQTDVTGPGVWITNYERVANFDAGEFGGVVLDESSILKNETGATRNQLITQFSEAKYRLSCTATPAPNDPEELTSQAEFLGHMRRADMLAAYFVNDKDTGWRIKSHGRQQMFKWMATWAVAIRMPSDMGWPDGDYILPGVNIIPQIVDYEHDAPDGQLFATEIGGVGGRSQIRKETLTSRVNHAANLVAAEPDEPWILWCGLNAEAEALAKQIPGAVNVHGGLTPEQKAEHLLGFSDGDIRVLVTKPKIASFGMNWQHCARQIFVGISDSYESYYQGIRRSHRYGQPREVDVHIVVSPLEAQIAANVARKESVASDWTNELVTEMQKAKINV